MYELSLCKFGPINRNCDPQSWYSSAKFYNQGTLFGILLSLKGPWFQWIDGIIKKKTIASINWNWFDIEFEFGKIRGPRFEKLGVQQNQVWNRDQSYKDDWA